MKNVIVFGTTYIDDMGFARIRQELARLGYDKKEYDSYPGGVRQFAIDKVCTTMPLDEYNECHEEHPHMQLLPEWLDEEEA